MGINSTDVISQQLNQVEEKVMVEGKDVDCSQLVTSSQHVLGIESVISEELNVESKVCQGTSNERVATVLRSVRLILQSRKSKQPSQSIRSQAWGLPEYREVCSCIGDIPMKPALLWHMDSLMTFFPFFMGIVNKVEVIPALGQQYNSAFRGSHSGGLPLIPQLGTNCVPSWKLQAFEGCLSALGRGSSLMRRVDDFSSPCSSLTFSFCPGLSKLCSWPCAKDWGKGLNFRFP